MKTQAYQCEFCLNLFNSKQVEGVQYSRDTPLFENELERIYSYCDPQKTNVHYCKGCYNERVINPANLSKDRQKNPEGWQELKTELDYLIRKQAYEIARKRDEKIKFG